MLGYQRYDYLPFSCVLITGALVVSRFFIDWFLTATYRVQALTRIQCCLQDVGAHVATPPESSDRKRSEHYGSLGVR